VRAGIRSIGRSRAVPVIVFVGLGFVVGSQLLSREPEIELIDKPLSRVAAALESGDASGQESGHEPGLPPPVSAAPSGEPVLVNPPPAGVFEELPASRDAYLQAAAHLDQDLSQGTGQGLGAPWDPARLVRWVDPPAHRSDLAGPLRVEYTMDVELTERIFQRMRRGRVSHGHVIVLEPDTGRVLAYASSDPDTFPATAHYPAASLVKIVTAAAALDSAPDQARRTCRYRGSPYRLTPSRVHPPRNGREMSLERSLATSNNQCFAQLAVNAIGEDAMLSAIERFGWLDVPAPGHAAGTATAGDDDYDLGRLGSGLAGARITPVHAAQLAASLLRGQLVEPFWVERVVDVHGRALPLPRQKPARQVMPAGLALELREMLVRTTTRGTARSAFRDRRGRQRLGDVKVAGKTGNLTGEDPYGRYEWFVALAPADAPKVAVAVLQLQSDLWWVRSSELGADVLSAIFCDGRDCRAELVSRYTGGGRQAGAVRKVAGLGG
jgi:hypothetical protein